MYETEERSLGVNTTVEVRLNIGEIAEAKKKIKKQNDSFPSNRNIIMSEGSKIVGGGIVEDGQIPYQVSNNIFKIVY